MQSVYKMMSSLINITKWLGMIIMFIMMAFIAFAVTIRFFDKPLLGDVEIVQYLMVTLIMFSLPYTQFINAHISIGLLVDKFSEKTQRILDYIAYFIIIAVSWTFSWVFMKASLNEMTGDVIKSTLLNVPNYPFKLIIALSFFTWGLVSLQQILQRILNHAEENKGGDSQ